MKPPIGPFLLLAAACALAFAGCARAPVEKNRDNVVIVVIDTLRRDHLATYGYSRDTAPFLGELARQGAVFDGLSPSSWTKPSTASLLTGLHPLRHQALDRLDRLPDGAVTLAERLRRAGYSTLGVSANGWISPGFHFDRGFATFLYRDSLKSRALNRELQARLDGLRPPFFLYVHYIDPHVPYEPETGWDGRPLPASPRAHPVTIEDLDAPHFIHRSPELLARARDLYDGEIRGVDDSLRELVSGLSRRGLMKNTILVVTADHGEELGEHGRMSHGQTVYQEVLQVPLVIYEPHRLPAGRRFGRASLMDVVPTLIDLLGLDRPQEPLDGQSLAGLLTSTDSREDPERPFLAHLDFTDGTGLAMIQGKWKLVFGKNPYRKEMFDLEADPGERHNLLGRPEVAETFSEVATRMTSLYDGYARAGLDRADVTLEASLSQSLAALGYTGGAARGPRPRAIPRRISSPGPWPGGRLGWEAAGALGSCLRLEQADSGRYLLAGWYDAGSGGRWSDRRASLVLASPLTQPSPRLLLSGDNYRPAPVRLKVIVEHQPVLETEVPCGPFQISASLAGVELRPDTALVEIETDTAFVPAEHGQADERSLGLFLRAACFKPTAGGKALRLLAP